MHLFAWSPKTSPQIALVSGSAFPSTYALDAHMKHSSTQNTIGSQNRPATGRVAAGQIPSWAHDTSGFSRTTVGKLANETASKQLSSEPMASGKALLSVTDVAEQLGVSTKTIRRILARRELPFLRIGRLIRVRQCDLISYLSKCNISLFLLCFILSRYYLLC